MVKIITDKLKSLKIIYAKDSLVKQGNEHSKS